MTDITSARLIKIKGLLFLMVGSSASALVVLDHPTVRTVVLLAVAIWCFCRFYYFAFYVIEHYVDARFRFSGLWSFARYLLQQGGSRTAGHSSDPRSKGDQNPRNP